MKKIIFSAIMILAFACNTDTKSTNTTANDSTPVSESNGVTGDVPMRTIDTATNITADTTKGSDTMRKP